MKEKKKRGRPAVGGRPHKYTVADDAHEFIMKNGGGGYITEIVRIIKAMDG